MRMLASPPMQMLAMPHMEEIFCDEKVDILIILANAWTTTVILVIQLPIFFLYMY